MVISDTLTRSSAVHNSIPTAGYMICQPGEHMTHCAVDLPFDMQPFG